MRETRLAADVLVAGAERPGRVEAPFAPRSIIRAVEAVARLLMAAAAVILVSATGMQGDVRRRVGQRVTPMSPCP
ncbi:MAG: hypothetical protein ABFD16_00125 [Thermoguttaceae bacterium]